MKGNRHMRIDAAVVLTAKKLFSIYRGSRTRMLCRIDPRKRITDRKRQKIEQAKFSHEARHFVAGWHFYFLHDTLSQTIR